MLCIMRFVFFFKIINTNEKELFNIHNITRNGYHIVCLVDRKQKERNT